MDPISVCLQCASFFMVGPPGATALGLGSRTSETGGAGLSFGPSRSLGWRAFNPWVDLRENLQETIDFPMKYGIFL